MSDMSYLSMPNLQLSHLSTGSSRYGIILNRRDSKDYSGRFAFRDYLHSSALQVGARHTSYSNLEIQSEYQAGNSHKLSRKPAVIKHSKLLISSKSRKGKVRMAALAVKNLPNGVIRY